MSRSVYGLLHDSRYPTIRDLLQSITDRLENDLIQISDNASSHNYTLDEIADQIDKVIEMISGEEHKYSSELEKGRLIL